MWPAARCWNWQLTSVFNEERSLAKDLLHPRIGLNYYFYRSDNVKIKLPKHPIDVRLSTSLVLALRGMRHYRQP